VKKIEERLGDPNVTLDSFLISNTPSHEMRKLWGIDQAAMVERNILFQQEDKESYVRKMLRGSCAVRSGRTLVCPDRPFRVRRAMAVFAILLAGAQPPPAPPVLVRIRVAGTKGELIPRSKGGPGYQRTFRFTATPAKSSHWIRQQLALRGTLVDVKGRTARAHLDVIEYYRVDASGRTLQPDSHRRKYPRHCSGTLTVTATLTYGTLVPKKRGDAIVGKSFILRSATNAAGKSVTMRKVTTGEIIPAEHGKRVVFHVDPGSIPTRYVYRPHWDACPGPGGKTELTGGIDAGTYKIEEPHQSGHTVAIVRPRPIPRLKTSG